MPGSGDTSVIDVTLTPVPTPTKSPRGIAILSLIGAVGAVALFHRDKAPSFYLLCSQKSLCVVAFHAERTD